MNYRIDILLPIALLACTGLNAATPGAYIGAGAGYSRLQDADGAQQVNEGGFGGRAFLGYNFNHYIGVETNYASMYKTRYALNDYQNVAVDFKLNALSFVAKGYLPLSNTGAFNVYGLIGAAEVFGDVDARVDYSSVLKDSNNAIVPTIGLGVSYDINQKLTTSFEFSAFGKNDARYNQLGIPESELATLGLAYHF